MGAAVGSKGAFSDINMTPLIDIVLVVLIIMMVNIPIQIEEMGLNLPAKVENPPPQDVPVDQLVIAVYEDGSTALNRTIMKGDQLVGEITRRLRPMSKKNVFIDAHPKVLYGFVVDMVDIAHRAGAERVAFAKVKPEGPASATSVASGALPRGVIFGSPNVAGEMTEKRADDALAPLRGVIEACYTAALGTIPTTGGQVMLQVDVGPDGKVMASEVFTDTTNHPELGKCILDNTAPKLGYEPLGEQKTARIRYPLIFSPG